MNRLIAAALTIALLLCVCVAYAGTANLTWTAPTTRTDGSALTGAVTYKVYRGSSAAAVASSTTALATVSAGTAYTDTTAPAGTQFYAVSTVDSAGVEGPKANAVSVVIPVAPPSPPTGLTVVAVIAGTNFSPVFRFDERGGPLPRAAGLIEAGATCTGPVLFKRDGHAYRRVSAKDVDVWFANENGRLAAACG